MSGLMRSLLTYPSPNTLLFDALASLDALKELHAPRTAMSTRQPLFLSYYNAAKKLAPLISYLFLSTAPKFLSSGFLISGHPL
jgi:hypothetical protein